MSSNPQSLRVLELLYQELRELATRQLDPKLKNPTLGPTALVNELVLKLKNFDLAELPKEQVLNLAATAMKRIVISHVRHRNAKRRGGNVAKAHLGVMDPPAKPRDLTPEQLEDVDRALDELCHSGRIDEQSKIIFRLRFYAGMTQSQCALALDVNEAKVNRSVNFVRTCLRAHLSRGNLDEATTR